MFPPLTLRFVGQCAAVLEVLIPVFGEWQGLLVTNCDPCPGITATIEWDGACLLRLPHTHAKYLGCCCRYDFGEPDAADSAATNLLLFEAQNVAEQYPAIVANLSAPLLAWHATLKVGPVSDHPGCAGFNWPTGETVVTAAGQQRVQPSMNRIFEDDPALML